MAGMGIDAMIMDETNPDLKDKIGPGAYFVAAAKALGRLPVSMRIRVDDHRVHRRRAMICVVGNVSTLAGNLVLIPGAQPDDGLLDVYVASPHRFTQWFRVFVRLITRRRQNGDRVDQWRGRRVEVVLERTGQLPAGRRRGGRAAPAGRRDPAPGADGPRSGLTQPGMV